jgi:hypothetical protein
MSVGGARLGHEMEAAQWTAIAIVAAGLFGAIFHLGSRLDDLSSRIDGLSSRIDDLASRLDGTNARIDVHLERHRAE